MKSKETALIVASALLCAAGIVTDLVSKKVFVDAFSGMVKREGFDPKQFGPQIRIAETIGYIAFGLSVVGVLAAMMAYPRMDYFPTWYRMLMLFCLFGWVLLAIFYFGMVYPGIGFGYAVMSLISLYLLNRRRPENSPAEEIPSH